MGWINNYIQEMVSMFKYIYQQMNTRAKLQFYKVQKNIFYKWERNVSNVILNFFFFFRDVDKPNIKWTGYNKKVPVIMFHSEAVLQNISKYKKVGGK